MFMMVLVTLSTLASVVVLNIHHRTPNTHQIPHKFRVLFLENLPRFLRMERPESDENETSKNLNYYIFSFLNLILIYKIIHGLSDLKFDNYFSFTTTPYSLRSHSFKIKTIISLDSSQSFNSFFGRVPPIWNKLPEQVVCSASLGIFKKSLKAHFKN